MIFAEAGVTTEQEGATHAPDLAIFEKGAKTNVLFIDVIIYPFILDLRPILKDHSLTDFGKYNKHLKIGGVKITSDGLPQSRTFFFTKPYLKGGPSGEKNWNSEPTILQYSLNT